MALDLWTAEGGTIGQTLTVGNSAGASGSAFFSVAAIPAGTSITYSDESANGNISLAFTRTSGSSTFYAVRSMTAATTRSVTMMVMFSALPNMAMTLMNFRSPADAQLAFVAISSTNRLEIRNALNVAISTATNPIVAGVWYRIEVVVTAGTTTTNGSGKWAYYIGNSGTAEGNFPISGVNFGTAASIQYHRFGRTGDTWVGTVYYDDLGLDNSTEYIGPVGVTPPLMVRSEGVVWRIDLRGSGSGNGGALTYPTPTRVSGPILTFTEPADGLFIFTQDANFDAVYTFVVSETGGSSSSQNITVPKVLTGGSGMVAVDRWSTARNEWE